MSESNGTGTDRQVYEKIDFHRRGGEVAVPLVEIYFPA